MLLNKRGFDTLDDDVAGDICQAVADGALTRAGGWRAHGNRGARCRCAGL